MKNDLADMILQRFRGVSLHAPLKTDVVFSGWMVVRSTSTDVDAVHAIPEAASTYRERLRLHTSSMELQHNHTHVP